jgi:hypothetical protein
MFPLGPRIGNPNSAPIATLFRPGLAQSAPPSLFDTRPRRSPPFSLSRQGGHACIPDVVGFRGARGRYSVSEDGYGLHLYPQSAWSAQAARNTRLGAI